MSHHRRTLLPAVAGLLVAAAPPPDLGLVRDAIIAEASRIEPAALAFDRTTTATKHSPLGSEKSVTIERWDGKGWTLVSVNGSTPKSSHRRYFQRATVNAPVPGYHRLAAMLTAAGEISTDEKGRKILKIAVLPAASVRSESDDVSSHLSGEAVITTTNGKPWVSQLNLKAREPFKLGGRIKVTEFRQTLDFGLGPNGRPRLTGQSALSKGQMFGFGGGEVNQVTYTYR
ncbi:hypothetical protein [Sandarakinorhabdus sp.]|uniref:hypothetical protein n=1 Tax=Sandarakinorhabdus sp. TaxID=1916663 RepID=UPI00333EDC15